MPVSDREIIFEFQPVGSYMKVTAMDTETLTEIIIQGPVGTSESVLQAQAIKRLEYVLRKKGLLET